MRERKALVLGETVLTPPMWFLQQLVSVVDMDASGSFTDMSLSHSSPLFDSSSSTSVLTQSTWDHGLTSHIAFLHSEVLLRRTIIFSLGSNKYHLAKEIMNLVQQESDSLNSITEKSRSIRDILMAGFVRELRRKTRPEKTKDPLGMILIMT